MNYKKIIAISFFAIFTVHLVSAEPFNSSTKVLRINAAELYDEYKTNYVRANKKYEIYDYFLIDGVIDNITSIYNEKIAQIELKTNHFFYTVDTQIPIHQYSDFIQDLSIGEHVSLLCPVHSLSYKYSVLWMKNCEPDEQYQIFLKQEKERVERIKEEKEAHLNTLNSIDSEDIQSPNITVSVASPHSIITPGFTLVTVSEAPLKQLVIEQDGSGRKSPKYFVQYRSDIANVMDLENVEIILPQIDQQPNNYLIYSLEDKNTLINTELKKIDQLLNKKYIDAAIANIDPYKAYLFSQKVNKNNVLLLNNLAYYLEQNHNYLASALILENIVNNFPTRVVARINLADAYWGLGESYHIRSLDHYNQYIDLMIKNGRKSKIPKRVYDRINNLNN